MSKLAIDIRAEPRSIPPGRDLDTPLYTLVWRAIQRWSRQIKQVEQERDAASDRENQAWIALADECFRLQRLYDGLRPAMEEKGLAREAGELDLAVRRLQQTLTLNGVEVVTPVGSHYTPDLGDILENAQQVREKAIEYPVVREVLAPIVHRGEQVIRFGKAVIAISEED